MASSRTKWNCEGAPRGLAGFSLAFSWDRRWLAFLCLRATDSLAGLLKEEGEGLNVEEDQAERERERCLPHDLDMDPFKVLPREASRAVRRCASSVARS